MGFVPCFCRPWGEHVRNGGSLRLLWLITHRGGCKQLWQEHGERHETTGKNTHPRTPHWLPPSLCVLQDLNMSLSAWDSHFPPLLAICSPCCGTLSCLWLQDFHKVARIVYLSLLKKQKQKENEKWWRTESGCCLDSHLGPLSCLVTRVFILNSCVCVHPLRQKRWAVVLSHNTLILLHIPLTIAVVRSVPMATTHNRPFYMVGVWSTAVLNVASCLLPGEVRELSF